MSTFTVHDRSPASRGDSVTWTDGRLSGDEGLIATIEGAVASGVLVALPGLYSGPPSLSEHGPALATVVAAFPGSTVAEGDEPAWQPLPDRAIP